MKKVTAFFMAFMPFFVIILLFISGMIVKNNVHIYVYGVEINEQDQDVLKENDDDKVQVQLHAHVLPLNATNPDVTWSVSDESILTVDADGLVTCKDYGEAFVYATSNENQTLSAACKFDVYDTVVHAVNVSNKYDASYVGLDSRTKINVETKPSLSHVDNPTVTYEVEEGKDYIELSDDGTIIPLKKTEKNKPAKVKIKAVGREAEGTKKAVDPVTTVDITVGTGVDTIALKNPNKEIVSDPHYDLFPQVQVAPADMESEGISASDFSFESDSQLAKIDENGHIQFFLPGTATFTVSYRRNPNIKVSKTIECTCNYLKQVYFDQSTVNVTLDESGETQTINDKLSWYVYPFNGTKEESKRTDGIEITSSDENVIEVRAGNGEPQLVVKGAGQAVLSIVIATNSDTYKQDTCLVNVNLDGSETTKEVSTNSCYYALRNALPFAQGVQSKQSIVYSIDESESDAEASVTGEVLNFKSNGTATVIAKIDDSVTRKIKVTCNSVINEIPLSDTITIPAGQRTLINGWEPVLEGTSYQDKFDLDGSVFIPKCGQDIESFQFKNGSQTKNVHLIVTEKPLYISSDSSDLRVFTSDYEVNAVDTIAAKVMPETATKKNGAHYQVDYSYYDPITAGTATIEDDVISFNQAGAINAVVMNDADDESDVLVQTYTVHSSYGDKLGKFEITNYYGSKVYESYGDPIELTPGSDTTLYSSDVSYSLYDDISITSTTGLCTVEKKWSGTRLLGHTEFNIKAPDLADKKYGRDIITISSNVYSVYLYVDITAATTDFVVTKGTTEINEGATTKTYTENLTFKVTPTPCVVKSEISATLNGTDCTVTDNYVTLPTGALSKGDQNKLIIKCGDVEKTFTLNYSTDTPEFWIDGAQDTKELYLAFNSIQKNCEIKTDGFVDDSWYESITYTSDEGVQLDISKKACYLTLKVPSPVAEPEYSNHIKMTAGSKTQEYTMGRDKISKIVLPKHNNNDMTDKKGLQKVHVYGNKSFYADDKKEVNYYKLPVQLYDYNRKLIKNTEENPKAVYEALSTLKVDVGNSNTTYKFNEQGFIEVYFGKNDLYTFEQIAENKFDAKQNKNVNFTLETKSNETKANYTFVAVDGVNQYCQEGLRATKDSTLSTNRNVLQCNFGLAEGSKDNTKFDDDSIELLNYLYGNGYTINFNTRYSHVPKDSLWSINVSSVSNVTIQACNDEQLNTQQSMDITDDYRDVCNVNFVYSIIKNFNMGVNLDFNERAKKPDCYYSFKNCLFTGSGARMFDIVDEASKAYFENCVIFNSTNFPVIAKHKGKVYFKGLLECYNFHSKEALKNFDGKDVSILWPTVLPILKANNAIQTGADGRDYMNTFMVTAMEYDCVFFYNPATKQYENSSKGFSGNAEHIAKIVDIKEKIFKIEAGFWGTKIPSVDIGAPSYYDEFDGDGNIRTDFLYNQLEKLTRTPTYF